MRNLYRVEVVLITLVVFLIGCGGSKIPSTATKSDEAFVFGRLILKGERFFVNKKVLVFFNNGWSGKRVSLDEKGYFYIKMPLGTSYMSRLEHNVGMSFFKNLPADYATVELTDPNKVYYIGDITLEWNRSADDQRQGKTNGIVGGVIDKVAEANKKGVELPGSVAALEETLALFKSKYPNNTKEVLTHLIKISLMGNK